MCSIFGALGNPGTIDHTLLDNIRFMARDRGRDGGQMQLYRYGSRVAYLGNWRATPTPELEQGALQPYGDRFGGVVHNGTIANDADLGAQPGEIDSQVLARHLLRSGPRLEDFADRLGGVLGSYAVAMARGGSVFVGVNYKPLHYWRSGAGDIYFSSMARHFDSLLPYGQAPVQVPPYSVLDLATGRHLALPRLDDRRAVVVCSAGLDSTTVAAQLVADGYGVCLLHFRYGCRAETREAALIPRIAAALGCGYAFLDVPNVFGHGSPLLGDTEISGAVAGAEYAHEWVPARNLVMMSLAAAYAEANGFHTIALGNNLEESGAYPDNEEQFILHLDAALHYAVQNGYRLRLIQPVGHLMKHEIVKLGLELGAPLDLTWSCYQGGERHCDGCGPCFMRRTAFERNGAADPVFA